MSDIALSDAVSARTMVRGRLRLDVFRRGEMIERWEDDNLVVLGMRLTLARLLGGDVANRSVTRIGFGTNPTPPVHGNENLTGAFVKALDGVAYTALHVVEFGFSLGADEANGLAISEFGLLTTTGVLVARRVRGTPLHKASDLSLSGLWSIEFLAGG